MFTANTISTGISTVMQETTVRGTAQVSINVNEEPRGSIILHAVDLKDQAVIDIDWEKASESKKVSVLIQRSNLLGGELRFHERVAPAHKRILHFEKCKFTGTRIKLPQRPERYEMIFDSCTFDVNPFYQHLPPDERPKVEIQGTTGFHGTLAIYAASEDSLLDDQWLRN